MKPIINTAKTKGEFFPIQRPHVLGNPYTLRDYSREEAIRLFGIWLRKKVEEKDERILEELDKAQKSLDSGVPLGCCCKPLACHGDEILAVLMEIRLRKIFPSPK